MNNYKKLFARGTMYVNTAGNNWGSRKNNLIKAWHLSPQRIRISKIIHQLDVRINTLAKMLGDFNEKQKVLKIIAEEQIIHLICPKCKYIFDPNPVGVGVKVKDYLPGRFKCQCGAELIPREETGIDHMLSKLGISKPPNE